ncbi:MAG: N-acetylmuramoyl-L-alanine amidase [Eubacteriales bacterium]|jgi:N-acetylmuramoyl-L-alanine amidase
MKRQLTVAVAMGALTALFAGATALYWTAGGQMPAFLSEQDNGYTVVLDPGHGGLDGGAQSPGGLVEGDVTIAIAQRVQELLELSGVKVVATRQPGEALHDPEAPTLKEKKMSDLKKRVELTREHPEALLVSIHLNSFPDPEEKGAQVFYKGGDPASQQLGQLAQQTMAEVLAPDNRRKAAEIPTTVYLMRNIDNTAALFECGFLSNPEEEALLGTEEYQEKVAFAVWLSLMRYWQQTG